MATFRPNMPRTTDEPVITVDPGLPPGQYRFRLVVVDDDGNASRPDERLVTILPRRLDPIDVPSGGFPRPGLPPFEPRLGGGGT